MIRRAVTAVTLAALAGCSAAGPSATALGPAFPYGVRVGFSAATPAQVTRVAAATGVTPAYVETFAGPGSSFPAAWASLAVKDKATLVIQLDTGSIPLSHVAAGDDDPWLRSYAKAVAAWPHPVAIGIDHEFNGPWWPWSYQHETASSFTAAWRHIVTVFRAEGAHVSWVWTISNVTGPQAAGVAAYWPGADYVSWIGVNAYYYRASDTFASVFTPVLAEARAISAKPVLVTETGANPASGQTRAIGDLFAGVAATPGVLGLVWFDFDKASAHGDPHNWLLDGNPAALAAFRTAARRYG
jgi:mannan endo-1,4-beta-mannosidase